MSQFFCGSDKRHDFRIVPGTILTAEASGNLCFDFNHPDEYSGQDKQRPDSHCQKALQPRNQVIGDADALN